MGVNVNYSTIGYRDQQQFDYFFATAFDKYDRNRDGKIDYNEFQPLVNEMCQLIIRKYGNGPTVDKIRQAWYAMDTNRSGYITRHEFSTRAKYEVERILSQPNYGAQPGYGAPGYGAQPGYGAPQHHHHHHQQPGYTAPGYGAPGYIPPAQQRRW